MADQLTKLLLADWAEHRRRKPYADGDEYAVHIDHLRIAADRWAAHDAALRLVIGEHLAEEAVRELEAGVRKP